LITFTRALARQLRAVLRKSVFAKTPKSLWPPIALQTDRDGLRIRAWGLDVAAEYHHTGTFAPERLFVPLEALDDLADRADTPVTLESTVAATVQVRWDDRGVPQVRDYQTPVPSDSPSFPELPDQWTELEPSFHQAFADAVQTAAHENIRYALDKLQLRGTAGELIGTDGKQLLVQTGVVLPWSEDLLVPAMPVFACRDLPADTPLAIGRTASHVGIRVGSWTFALAIDKEGRFPKVEKYLPQPTTMATTWRLAAPETAFLLQTLPRLPGREDQDAPVTVDLHQPVAVRAKAEGQERLTEVLLPGSEVLGPPVRFCVARQYLLRALQLGFVEIHIANAELAAVCRDGRRNYAWMPLDKRSALAPSDNAVRIASQTKEPVGQQLDNLPQPTPEKRKNHMSKPSINGSTRSNGADPQPPANGAPPQTSNAGLGSVIEEAQALKNTLREAYDRISRLLAALQRQRKHSKLFQSALTSLRQLQQIDQ